MEIYKFRLVIFREEKLELFFVRDFLRGREKIIQEGKGFMTIFQCWSLEKFLLLRQEFIEWEKIGWKVFRLFFWIFLEKCGEERNFRSGFFFWIKI